MATQLCLTLLIRSVAATRSFRITFHPLVPSLFFAVTCVDVVVRAVDWAVTTCECARTTGKKVVCPANFVFLYFCRAVLKYDAISGTIKLQGLKRHNTHLHTLTRTRVRSEQEQIVCVDFGRVSWSLCCTTSKASELMSKRLWGKL